MRKKIVTCGVCTFYVQHSKTAEYGECRRFPPTATNGDFSFSQDCEFTRSFDASVARESRFPNTEPQQWCGEFKRKL